MAEVWVVGHVTKDTVRIGGAAATQIAGGVAYYSALAYQRLGVPVAVLTKVAPADSQWCLEELRASAIDTVVCPTPATTRFENRYVGSARGARHQQAVAVAAPFAAADLDGIGGRCVHLGPLTAGDMPEPVVAAARQRFDWLVLDIQGYLRTVQGTEVIATGGAGLAGILAAVDILKASQSEAARMTGCTDPHEAARKLSALGPREVVITQGDRGALIVAAGAIHQIAAVPAKREVDSTGCGDTFLAAYVALRLDSADPAAAGKFAAAAAARKLEAAGALNVTRAEIETSLV